MKQKSILSILVLLLCNIAFSQDQKPMQLQRSNQSKYISSGDIKWSMFGLNRVHVQDFGITDQYVDTCNCGESRAFLDKANVTVGLGFYSNLSKNFAISGDLGLSYGTVAKKVPIPSDKKQLWFSTFRFDSYYHLSDNRLQMRPYLFGGLHGSQRSGKTLVSLPLGFGIRYMLFNDNGMITAQAGYGLGLTNNLKNNIIYSWGLYVNMSRKKKSSSTAASNNIDGCCTLPSDDTDCDGVVDRLDKCPTVPGPVSSFGCPSSDRDLDGITDENDRCPDVPGPITNQGCPVADRDGDGLSDPYDKCPDIAGPPSNDGCPIQDRDKDGIPDNQDQCPDVYGLRVNNGCPETKIPEGSNINYRPNSNPRSMGDTVQYIIYFDFDKYNLTVTSFEILDEVKEYIKRHDDYNIMLVGHTDLEGDLDYNVRLSENRVKTSKNYLISYGIPAARISTNFFGKTQPAIPSFDKSLAWKNRRVEIYLIKSK